MATILIVDDDDAMREGLAETVTDLGYRARLAASGKDALALVAAGGIDAVLLDLRMPGGLDGIEVLRRIRAGDDAPPVVVLTAFAGADNTIEAMRLGAFDHLTKPIGRDDLKSILLAMLAQRGPAPSLSPVGPSGGLIGASEAIRRVQKTIGLAADGNATVLILGETGTGKELVARALHEHGRRKDKAFIAVNCAAIPTELLESELFGHVKGAFTGAAADRAGAFREADGGTLFLDEIGDMPGAMQAKILRVLQDKVVTPVGGKPVRVDVRVIAATHQDLPALVSAGNFREDLYYRLNVVPIVLPPLRERRGDIELLARHFLQLSAWSSPAKTLTAAAIARLRDHSWPGNVRELRNTIERAVILVRGNTIDAADLDDLIRDSHASQRDDVAEGDLPAAVAKLEYDMIRKTLEACGGNRAEAARRLNIHRQLLYTKMQRYGLIEPEASGKPTSGVGNSDS
jgi:two-component system NtrC family response regulator